MIDKETSLADRCPFCDTQIQPEEVVCTVCRATRKKEVPESTLFRITVFGFVIMPLVALMMGMAYRSFLLGIGLLAGGVLLAFLCFFAAKEKWTWRS